MMAAPGSWDLWWQRKIQKKNFLAQIPCSLFGCKRHQFIYIYSSTRHQFIYTQLQAPPIYIYVRLQEVLSNFFLSRKKMFFAIFSGSATGAAPGVLVRMVCNQEAHRMMVGPRILGPLLAEKNTKKIFSYKSHVNFLGANPIHPGATNFGT
jgi:hypothetical protein